MCGAPDQSVALPAGTDLTKETVLTGRVLAERLSRSAARSSGCWTARGEFTAEVVTSAAGDFRFFAAPGTWTLRALSRSRQRRGRGHGRGPGPAHHGAPVA